MSLIFKALGYGYACSFAMAIIEFVSPYVFWFCFSLLFDDMDPFHGEKFLRRVSVAVPVPENVTVVQEAKKEGKTSKNSGMVISPDFVEFRGVPSSTPKMSTPCNSLRSISSFGTGSAAPDPPNLRYYSKLAIEFTNYSCILHI